MRAHSELALALSCAIACSGAVAQAKKRGTKVIEILRQIDMRDPEAISVPVVPIVDVPLLATPPAAAPAPDASCARLYCNDGFNSRLPGAAPTKALEVRWAVPFTPSFQPANVLQAGDRVLAYGSNVFRLYDLDGKIISEGRTGAGGMVLDAEHSLFYFINSYGEYAAHRLADGGEEFNLQPAAGDAWTFLARRGEKMFDLAVELPKPWRKTPPQNSIFQHLDLPTSLQRDDGQGVLNLTGAGALYLKSAAVKVAMSGDRAVLAVPGQIITTSVDLQPGATFNGDFVPQALSLDELGRIHLVIQRGEQRALWIMTPAGQRTIVALKPEYGKTFGPPIIGYDHKIFLLHSGLSTYDAQGNLLWERWLKGRVAGAGVTTDGQLLVSGGDLAAYDEKGERRILFMLPGVSFVTPPAMSSKGEIFVASKDSVYCLAPHKK